uniref:Maestro heat-like repeat family member 5 n=1 Tax=Molossus molossus TaxID=27622 RepID=A0A7J8BB29_MOLMO|nr:hypothetical protein HJG59_012431 [Molossus molossus]
MASAVHTEGPSACEPQKEEEKEEQQEEEKEEEQQEEEKEEEQKEQEEEDNDDDEEEDEELDIDFPGQRTVGEPPTKSPSWEKALVGKIAAMSVIEKRLLLEAIRQCIQDQNQRTTKAGEVPDVSTQELLGSLNLGLKQPLEKTFLFRFYGLTLREFASADLVKKHLAVLLQLSLQSPSQRSGIALAIGITAASHMEVVWAMMEQLGHTRVLRSSCTPPDSQVGEHPDPSAHGNWVSSTSLLCYGQMALHAGGQILPWVDNIISRMVYYYSRSSHDTALNRSFLSAAAMLTKVLRWESSTQSYKFTQIPELIQGLLCTLQEEPNCLATLFRPKVISVIAGLSSLRPSLKPMVKSRILQTCFQSLYQLPPMETMKRCSPSLESAPDVMVLYQKSTEALNLLLQTFISENKSMDEVCFLLQHTEPWLKSDQSHERQRAVQSIFLLLKCMVDYMGLTEDATPSMLGHQVGLLMLLWRDKDEATKNHSCQCVCLLLQLLLRQKGSLKEFTYLNKMKNSEARTLRESEMKFYHLVQALDENLTVAQHTMLILTLLHGLCSPNHVCCDLASHLLLMVFEDGSVKAEQMAEILQGLFREIPCIIFKDILQTVMKAVTVLGTQHTQETVEVMLSLCHPSERQVVPLWKALASNNQLARKVITLLYVKLKLRPPQLLIRLSEQVELVSVLALDTIYELLYIKEYKAIVRWAFAGILLGLLTQLYYLFELGMVKDAADSQEDVLDMKRLGPCSTCLEALKGLFWTTNYWEVFAYLKLQRGWELFEHLETYTEGVTLLARAMVHYDCEIKATLGQAIIALKSSEERENIVAILIITEFLNSQEVTQYMSRKAIHSILSLGLSNSNQMVRAMSLMGLGSILMEPQKVVLLRNRLAGLLDSFQKPEPKSLVGLMEIVGDILHCLGHNGIGAVSLKIAQLLLPLFEDEQEDVRGGAISLYGDVIHSGGRKFQQGLKSHAFQSLVPLLLHLADSCPEVVMKTKLTFLRCAILLKWEFRKQLFSKLAWGQGLGAENDIFMCMVESNFGRCHQFLMQASVYLRSPHKNLKLTAMKFIGGILQDYFTNLCFYLKKGDVKFFRKQFEVLRQEQDSACRRFYRSFLDDVTELYQYSVQ